MVTLAIAFRQSLFQEVEGIFPAAGDGMEACDRIESPCGRVALQREQKGFFEAAHRLIALVLLSGQNDAEVVISDGVFWVELDRLLQADQSLRVLAGVVERLDEEVQDALFVRPRTSAGSVA